MINISLCMIVKNEEEVIARCLDSIKDAVDEIIIVDTGSTDKTKEIVKEYTDLVFDFEWIDNFAAARNYAFSKATKDFVMWLDADDIMLKKDKLMFLNLKKTLEDNVDMVMMKYNVAFDEYGNPTFSYYRERLFRRSNGYKWVGQIHEVIAPSGNIMYSEVGITHKRGAGKDPLRNLKIFEKMIRQGKTLEPREQFYYSRELYYNGRFDDAIKGFTKFLDSDEGWVEDCISACKDMAICYYRVGKEKEALYSYFRSFEFDRPRAEICCDIAKHLLDRGVFNSSIFWYKTASNMDINDIKHGFKSNDCYDFIPYLQLSVCYDRIGDLNKALFYHEKAKKLKPKDKSVLYNEEYFVKIKSKNKKK